MAAALHLGSFAPPVVVPKPCPSGSGWWRSRGAVTTPPSSSSEALPAAALTGGRDDDGGDRDRSSATSGAETSLLFALDPDSEEAERLTSRLGLAPAQHSALVRLSHLIVEWNDRINLVSRKDCTPAVVFGRHVLPSLALLKFIVPPPERGEGGDDGEDKDGWRRVVRVVDVGTGGGFPGLPLAVACSSSSGPSEVEFLLVDSVGKKLAAVNDVLVSGFGINTKDNIRSSRFMWVFCYIKLILFYLCCLCFCYPFLFINY